MSLDLAIRQASPQEPPRQPVRAAGVDRVAGAAPPPATSFEVGPPNPRLRMDRDLGMVVIEFRDASGKISNSLPTERELQAYRASINYGADLPMYLSPLRQAPVSFSPPAPVKPQPAPTSFGSMAFGSGTSFTSESVKQTA